MEAARRINGERMVVCRLPRGDEPGFTYSMEYAPDDKGKRRIDGIKLSVIRERVALTGMDISEDRMLAWSKAYPYSVVVAGGPKEKPREPKKKPNEKLAEEPNPLEVAGYEILRRVEDNVTIVTVLPVEDAKEKAEVVSKLRKTWPNAEICEGAGIEGLAAGMLRDGKQPVIFR